MANQLKASGNYKQKKCKDKSDFVQRIIVKPLMRRMANTNVFMRLRYIKDTTVSGVTRRGQEGWGGGGGQTAPCDTIQGVTP